jgi:Predicted nucleic acid-binding protein, contains PIN domain
MKKYLFDSNIIYKLIRETPEKALEKLNEGTTIYLAYYELGNALWRECRLLKRLSVEEAEKSLELMYTMLLHMQIATVNNKGVEILATANEFNLTFYDSAYLVEAKQNNRVLVTDDAKLAKTAETLGVATISSNILINS